LRSTLTICALLLPVLGGGCGRDDAPSSPPGPVPRDFVGIVAQDVLKSPPARRARDLATMQADGIGVLRQPVDWGEVQPRRGRIRWGALDGWAMAAARQQLDLLVVLSGAPVWAGGTGQGGTTPPRDPRDLARFAAALVHRYGPGGSLWRRHPGVPARRIRAWQVWNEPNLPQYWNGRPDPAGYVRMLRVVGGAIRRADPRATVVSAGLPNSREGVPFEPYVRGMYRAGAKGTFDVFGMHPYAASGTAMADAVAGARDLLDQLGDTQRPLWVTETGWADGGPASPFTVGPAGQARSVAEAFDTLAREREELKLRGVVYYAWRDVPPPPGQQDFFGLHTGLLTLRGARKPAYDAFVSTARELER
jgi:hypothetical protein